VSWNFNFFYRGKCDKMQENKKIEKPGNFNFIFLDVITITYFVYVYIPIFFFIENPNIIYNGIGQDIILKPAINNIGSLRYLLCFFSNLILPINLLIQIGIFIFMEKNKYRYTLLFINFWLISNIWILCEVVNK
jgi:hypothetical protein